VGARVGDEREVTVWRGDVAVGSLRELRGGGISFAYSPDYLNSARPQPLSISLPLREASYDSPATRPYFANILPDAELRKAVARKLGLSDTNDFALLEAIGGECPGAVSLLPVGAGPSREGKYERLTPADFDKLIEELPRRPLLAGEKGLRLSLAGAQEKLALRFEGGEFYLATGGLATTHIVKPAIRMVEGSVQNEAFCMALAGRVGLPVPRSWIHHAKEPVYVVERFDRLVADDGSVTRLHAEDFCQATGRPPERKYEAEGGPPFRDCFALIKDHSIRPALDQDALVRLAVFNALAHNSDAHAKNLSLLYGEQGPVLAPFYDLLCTGVYDEHGVKMAMGIGGEKRPAWIRRRHWERFAADIQVGRSLVIDTVADLATRMPEAAAQIAKEQVLATGDRKILAAISSLVEERCRAALVNLRTQDLGR
jgi:serine/threonine-protein kinase HipA